jgi:DNA adenine methylase
MQKTSFRHTTDVTRSVLRYFGGKWALAPWIIGLMPPHKVYVEPFGGGGGVLLRKPRAAREVYNDLDEEVVGIFRLLQNPAQCARLIRLLKRTPYARAEYQLAFQPTTDPVLRAQRAIIRSFLSIHHSALFMPSKAGSFASTGSGCRSWANYPRHLVEVCRRLRGVVVENRDASQIIATQDSPDTLFFVDPPYVPTTRNMSTRYRHEMPESAHVALLEKLNAIKGRAMVAGYPSALYDRLLDGWERREHEHYARANGVRKVTEVLWISPEKNCDKSQTALGLSATQSDVVPIETPINKGDTP